MGCFSGDLSCPDFCVGWHVLGDGERKELEEGCAFWSAGCRHTPLDMIQCCLVLEQPMGPPMAPAGLSLPSSLVGPTSNDCLMCLELSEFRSHPFEIALGPRNHGSPHSMLQKLGRENNLETSPVSSSESYNNIFLCLCFFFSNHRKPTGRIMFLYFSKDRVSTCLRLTLNPLCNWG